MSNEQSRISSMGTMGAFLAKGTCSQTAASVLNSASGHPLPAEERAADPLAGGIAQHGYQCGLIWGAVLAAGAEAFRRFGDGPEAETKAILAAQRIVESYRAQNKTIDCGEITGLNEESTPMQMTSYFLLKGGMVGCLRMAARYVPVARSEIGAALSAEPAETPCAPVSCAAVLARRLGASGMHAVMAAGFAGGIGLSGGGCGALGAAIWIAQMNAIGEGRKPGFKSADAAGVIARFVKCTGCEFECAKIVGRRFEDAADHARHVQNGGCAKILDALAAPA